MYVKFATVIVFGPVPSRRLGRSLGINNIPPKHCSYSCIYCQIGRTLKREVERRKFYEVNEIVKEVENVVKSGSKIDYITFVPDGEPTLDINLGLEISEVKKFGIKVAVLTNGSLLYLEEVREDLKKADLVSVKVDSWDERSFKLVNRPHKSLSFKKVLSGIYEFSSEYRGVLITETMLIKGINDSSFDKVSNIIQELSPKKAYIAIPIRPPAESWVKPASEEKVLEAYEVFKDKLGEGRVELLIGYEGADFGLGKRSIEDELLSIISVHPMRMDYVEELVRKRGREPTLVVNNLLSKGKIEIIDYMGKRFLIKRFGYRGSSA